MAHPELERSPALRLLQRLSLILAVVAVGLAFWLLPGPLGQFREAVATVTGPGLLADALCLGLVYVAAVVGLQLVFFSGYYFVNGMRGRS